MRERLVLPEKTQSGQHRLPNRNTPAVAQTHIRRMKSSARAVWQGGFGIHLPVLLLPWLSHILIQAIWSIVVVVTEMSEIAAEEPLKQEM